MSCPRRSGATTMPVEISVVIPCFNAALHVSETLATLVPQRSRLHQIIVVDDGSTDDSGVIARRFSPAVQVLRQNNAGVSAARNTGLGAVTGTYALFLDADDLLAPRAVEELSRIAGQSSVAVMGSTAFRADQSTAWEKSPPERLFPNVLFENPSIMGSWMAPVDVLRRLRGFRTDMTVFEDWEMFARLAFAGIELRTSPYIGVRYRLHESSCMATAAMIKRAKGHVQVVTSICRLSWSNRMVLEQFGKVLFWSALTALDRGKQADVEANLLSRPDRRDQ